MNQNNSKLNIIPLKDLNLTDRFLFDEVMEDPHTQQDVLSIILGREISLLSRAETEKEFRLSPSIRSIRMDVFSMDQEFTVYDTEMQHTRKMDLEKRSRYYQALLDTSLLEPGIPNYNLLNDSYLILITTFDLFGLKKYRYTFRPRCEESPDCILQDGTTRIFLNTRGENENEVPDELVEFLHYLEHTTDTSAENTGSRRIKRIHERVCKVKASEEIGMRYMQELEERYYDMKEAHEDGLAEGEHNNMKKLVSKKLQKGKSEEIIADELEESIETIRQLIAEIGSTEET